MKKIISVLLFLAFTSVLFSQEFKQKTLYKDYMFEQTLAITEDSDGNRCRIKLFMSDNHTTQTRNFDSEYATVYSICSKWFSNTSEYSNVVEASKEFLNHGMLLIYLADFKDICDIAPCCKSLNYRSVKTEDGMKFIFLEYECSDLEKLFEIAWAYHANGRMYALEKYPRIK